MTLETPLNKESDVKWSRISDSYIANKDNTRANFQNFRKETYKIKLLSVLNFKYYLNFYINI